MRELLISGGVSIVLATVGFALGRLNLRTSMSHERNEDLRRRRIDTYAAFCASIVEYRRAQLNRWFVRHELGTPRSEVDAQRPDVAEDVRRSRAAAWADFYRVLMICDDEAIEELGRDAMKVTRGMKQASDVDEVLAISDQVHAAVDAFARGVANSVLAPEQPPLGPARQAVVPRGERV